MTFDKTATRQILGEAIYSIGPEIAPKQAVQAI
jgi:hypothetical protein